MNPFLKTISAFLFFSLTILNASAQPDTLTASEIFVLLPDSVFNKQHSPFSNENPLTIDKRKSFLSLGDSILKNEAGEDIMKNYRAEKVDENTLIISNLTGRSVSVAVWKTKNKNLIVGLIHKKCDFVMCFENIDFYEYDGKTFTHKILFDQNVALKYFFPAAELKRCGFGPEDKMYRIDFSFGEKRIYFNMQDAMLDPELMSSEGLFVCLGLDKKYLKEYFYEWDGKKFKMVTLKMSTD